MPKRWRMKIEEKKTHVSILDFRAVGGTDGLKVFLCLTGASGLFGLLFVVGYFNIE